MNPRWILYGVGAGVALLALNALVSGRLVAGAASALGRLPVDAFMGGAEGLLGLPDTRTAAAQSKCATAKASGDCWEASLQCPAIDYLRCMREKYL